MVRLIIESRYRNTKSQRIYWNVKCNRNILFFRFSFLFFLRVRKYIRNPTRSTFGKHGSKSTEKFRLVLHLWCDDVKVNVWRSFLLGRLIINPRWYNIFKRCCFSIHAPKKKNHIRARMIVYIWRVTELSVNTTRTLNCTTTNIS